MGDYVTIMRKGLQIVIWRSVELYGMLSKYMCRKFNIDTNNVGWIKDEGRIHQ